MHDTIDQLLKTESRLELWREFIKSMGCRSVVEVGVWKGAFSEEVLRECGSIESYHMIDPWATLPDWNKPYNVDSKQFDDIYSEAMQATEFAAEKRIVHRGKTSDVASEIEDGSIDYAYVDGDHTLRGITIDLTLILPKVRPGGYLTGDDFTNTAWQHDARYEPTLVCPYAVYFAEAHGLPIVALPHSQFLIHNTPEAGFSFTDKTGDYSDVSIAALLKKQSKNGSLQGSLVQAAKKMIKGG